MTNVTDDEQSRRIDRLEREHDDTRWWVRRLDRDIERVDTSIRDLRDAHDRRFDAIDRRFDTSDERQQALAAAVDSVDAQLRSLTQMVGDVLGRLPAPPQDDRHDS